MTTVETESGSALSVAQDLLMTHYKYPDFLPGQEAALRSVFSGRDLLVVMPTGSGKSLIYQLPALMGEGLAIVISPLISLMKDQVDELGRIGIPATFVNSSLEPGEQRARMAACLNGAYHLLYIAPERCRNEGFNQMLGGLKVSRLAVDEAHCISEWGHDFRPDYRRIKEFRGRIGDPPVTALTATATKKVREDIIESLGLDKGAVDVHVHGFDRPNLSLSVVMAQSNQKKADYLAHFITNQKGPGIIYAGTRKNTEELAEILRPLEPGIVSYHAGMQPEERTGAQDAFLSGEARIVVATSAFGMGIDKRDVRFVVHYNYPGSIEQYYQEIGRAGRDGLKSDCVLLYSTADGNLRNFFIDINYPEREQIEAVYNTLWARSENPVLLTYRQIGELCDENINEGMVGSAIRILAGAGAIRAFTGAPKIAVTTSEPYSAIKSRIRGPVQQRIMEAMAAFTDLETPGRFEIELFGLAVDAGVSMDQVRRGLTALHESGLVRYERHFRGRGIEKVPEARQPFEELSIDWPHLERLRKNEEDKLRAMETFINSYSCRRGYILSYFGEKKSFSCGTCDFCLNEKVARDVENNVVSEKPEIALPVLGFLKSARFPIGKNRIADVVTGSRSKQVLEWKLDRSPAYGLVTAKKAEVLEVIEQMMLEGLVEITGDSHLPVLRLTEDGRNRAIEFKPGEFERIVSKKPSSAGKPYGDLTQKEIEFVVLECVDNVPYSIGAGKIAGVLTGSRAKWIEQAGIDGLDIYGTLNTTQEYAKETVLKMIDDGLLCQKGSSLYPTIGITNKGRARLNEGEGSI